MISAGGRATRMGVTGPAVGVCFRRSSRSPRQPGSKKKRRSGIMCGIVAYVGKKICQPLLIEGLKRLEYRGYDSAGIAVIDDVGSLHIRRAVGRISVLEEAIESAGAA